MSRRPAVSRMFAAPDAGLVGTPENVNSDHNQRAGNTFMAGTASAAHDAVYRKIGRRLMPFLLACYIINYLDRVSIGYAKLQFQSDLHINEAV
jgi:hypothetical protein